MFAAAGELNHHILHKARESDCEAELHHIANEDADDGYLTRPVLLEAHTLPPDAVVAPRFGVRELRLKGDKFIERIRAVDNFTWCLTNGCTRMGRAHLNETIEFLVLFMLLFRSIVLPEELEGRHEEGF